MSTDSKIKIFHECWNILHSFEFISCKRQLEIFLILMNELSDISQACSCSNEGLNILNSLMLHDPSLFEKTKMENSRFFWWWFHNEVNFKLGKGAMLYDGKTD